jgi:hypothetical protein
MRRKQLKIPVTPEFLRSVALRDAAGVGAYGWRPTAHELANLRASTRDAIAYRIMLRAWRSAGFSTAAIRRLAQRKPKLRERNSPPPPAQTSLAAIHDHTR